MTDDTAPQRQLADPPVVRQLGSVPVFNCHIYLSSPPEGGPVVARGANLSEIRVEGRSDREALAAAVRAFKEAIGRSLAGGQAIPWIDPPLPAEPGERQRWVPVHF